jgi:hypothetical protein
MNRQAKLRFNQKIMCVESIGMIDTGGHVIFKRGKKYAAILMARVTV